MCPALKNASLMFKETVRTSFLAQESMEQYLLGILTLFSALNSPKDNSQSVKLLAKILFRKLTKKTPKLHKLVSKIKKKKSTLTIFVKGLPGSLVISYFA